MQLKFYFICAILYSVTIPCNLYAQVKSALKHLKKNNYSLAQSAFEADLSNATEQASAEFYLAQLHANPNYTDGYNLPLAYQYTEKAIASSHKANPASRKKLDQRGFGLLRMRKFKEDIINTALDSAETQSTSAAYNEFIRTYTDLNAAQTERVARTRNRIAFQEASSANTTAAWQQFWTNYRASCSTYTPNLYAQAQAQLFGAYIRHHGWRHYAHFAAQYPDNPFSLDSAAAVKMQLSAQKNTPQSYKDMIQAYPKSPFTAVALDSLFSHTIRSTDPIDFDYFIHSYPQYPQLPKLFQIYQPIFCQSDPDCPNSFFKKYPQAQPK